MALPLAAASCDRAAPTSGDGAPSGSVTASPAATAKGPGSSPIQSDADCRKAPVCKDFGACTHTRGQCTVTASADCAASTFCKMAGKCVAYQGQCRMGATADADCDKPHGSSGVNPCKTKGNCTAKDGVCLVGKNEDCAQTQACRQAGMCTARNGRCEAGSEQDCRQSMACSKAKACEFQPGKDGVPGHCAAPPGSAKPGGHEGHGH
ncbi:MAG: hypothetical protein JRI68_01090 [Deltaproteobacteria bacterium]|nr:hypothetical protein [Deltaproteobacteria bacterium]